MNENLFEEIKNQADIINKIKRESYQLGYDAGRKDEKREMLEKAEKDEAKVEQLRNE